MQFYLAHDALESVKLLPTSAPLWQRMCSFTGEMPIEQKKEFIGIIKSLVFASSDANWLRGSALAYLTRHPVWFAQQAALANDETSPDAIMTLLGLAWYHTLARASDSQTFVQTLHSISAPRLQRLVAKRLPASTATRPANGAGVNSGLRFAIYTPQIIGTAHGGTTFTLNMMSILSRLGLTCQTFAAQEANIPDANSHTGGIEFLGQVSVEMDSLALNVPGTTQIIVPNTELSLRCRYEQVLTAIHDYKPDVVVFVGFMSPMIYCLFESYPVVGLSLHALPPIAPVDVWLSADAAADRAPWPDLHAPQVAHYPFRFWPKGKAVPVDRAALQVPESAVVLITTGNRLDTEMPQPWLDKMVTFLDANQNVHWLQVGMPQDWQHVGLPMHPRIHNITQQQALEPWLAASDIYVNPPRMGGGASVAMAMEQGLAVLTLAGSDGGDKVDTWAAVSVDAYFAQLSDWVCDAAIRKRVGQALHARFNERLDMSGIPAQDKLMQACQAAIASYNERTMNVHG